jgi:hypothetical protein
MADENVTDVELIAAPVLQGQRRLTAAEFQGLAKVPPEKEWLANIVNPHTTAAT